MSTEKEKKFQTSAYDAIWNIDTLREERARFLALPEPFANVAIVERWRRRQVWLLSMRLEMLNRERRLLQNRGEKV